MLSRRRVDCDTCKMKERLAGITWTNTSIDKSHRGHFGSATGTPSAAPRWQCPTGLQTVPPSRHRVKARFRKLKKMTWLTRGDAPLRPFPCGSLWQCFRGLGTSGDARARPCLVPCMRRVPALGDRNPPRPMCQFNGNSERFWVERHRSRPRIPRFGIDNGRPCHLGRRIAPSNPSPGTDAAAKAKGGSREPPWGLNLYLRKCRDNATSRFPGDECRR